MHKKRKSEKMEQLVSFISQRLEGFQSIPSVLADRALKIGALSFFCAVFWLLYGKADGFSQFHCMVSGNRDLWLISFLPSAWVRGKAGV